MKGYYAFLLCICCVFLLAGCAGKPEPVVIDVTRSEVDAAKASEPSFADADKPASGRGEAKAVLRDSVAYALGCQEGPALYGAAAYENTGNAPLVLTSLTFTFHFDGNAEEVTFSPIFSDKAVVLPGETAYAVLWFDRPGLVPGTAVELSVSNLMWEQAESERIAISVNHTHLAENYPGFTTLAGMLTAEADCACNVIYAAFYDEAGKLMGVWYFTENAQLVAKEPKAFTSHMKEFPLEDLAARAAQVRYFGVGME